ncbi:MAG: fructose 1,6-bisphosphatase [Candidatus Diapherotrites archaeon]|nr:fructose 1,6-bisphosphatase [Candidatus Diapherotrites archaeon]
MKTTISVIKADIGGFPGHVSVHKECMEIADKELGAAKNNGLINDYRIMRCGDDLELIMSHTKGINNEEIHKLAWDTFIKATEKAKSLKLYGAGQDLLSDSFSGNVKGMGPGVAEIEFEERKSDPLIIFMADKTAPGAWNLPLYKIFADPFNTAGLVIDPKMHDGFVFEVHDVIDNKRIELKCPEESYDLLSLIGATDRYCVKSVKKKNGEICSVSSTQRLNFMAGRYIGKDDPVCIVRAQSGFPAVGEVLEPFAFPFMVKGWMRGSHHGPFMPVPFEKANPSRFDGPPRVIAAGFQVSNGMLIGPSDLFDDPSFDKARAETNLIADYIRRHGPFEPHRLPMDEMEYTTLPGVLEKLKSRFEVIE